MRFAVAQIGLGRFSRGGGFVEGNERSERLGLAAHLN